MNKTNAVVYLVFLLLLNSFAIAKDDKYTTIDLKHISSDEVLTILKQLTNTPISNNENKLIFKANKKESKNLISLIKRIDTPPTPLLLEFISSKIKMDFNQRANVYESNNQKTSNSQSIRITEGKWVALSTGISTPIHQRSKNEDGTETDSVTYKKSDQRYQFKVHEINNKIVVEVKINASIHTNQKPGAIEHKELETTIVGKTNEWIEVSSTNQVNKNTKDNIYSTSRPSRNTIHLYIKVNK